MSYSHNRVKCSGRMTDNVQVNAAYVYTAWRLRYCTVLSNVWAGDVMVHSVLSNKSCETCWTKLLASGSLCGLNQQFAIYARAGAGLVIKYQPGLPMGIAFFVLNGPGTPSLQSWRVLRLLVCVAFFVLNGPGTPSLQSWRVLRPPVYILTGP